MPAMGEPGPYAGLLQNIKRALDPNGILAPGRYVPMVREAVPAVTEIEREKEFQR
jgi:hypothetical protein